RPPEAGWPWWPGDGLRDERPPGAAGASGQDGNGRAVSSAGHRRVRNRWPRRGPRRSMCPGSARRGMLPDMANPAPVTLSIGDEEFLADRAIRATVAQARGPAPGIEVQELAGGEAEPGEPARGASPALVGARSARRSRSGQELTKAVINEVLAYAADPAEDVHLIVAHEGGAKGKALVDGLKKAGAHVITVAKPTKPGERLDFIRGEFERAGR